MLLVKSTPSCMPSSQTSGLGVAYAAPLRRNLFSLCPSVGRVLMRGFLGAVETGGECILRRRMEESEGRDGREEGGRESMVSAKV